MGYAGHTAILTRKPRKITLALAGSNVQILSDATRRFLEPIPVEKLRGATLRVSLKPVTDPTNRRQANERSELAKAERVASGEDTSDVQLSSVKSFILEIFDTTITDGVVTEVSPQSYTALSFVRKRFKHGYRLMSSNWGGRTRYHESYEVPATDYSLYLILHTWTSHRIISPDCKSLFTSLVQQETAFSRCAERSAIYKSRLAVLLEEYKLSEREALFNDDIDLASYLPETCMQQDTALLQKLHINPFLSLPSSFNPTAPTLTLYQQVAASNAISVDGYALFKEPGCGKTAPAISVCDYVAAHTHATANRPARILILTPKNIRRNWEREIAYFSKVPSRVSILTGANENIRTFALIDALLPVNGSRANIVILNYECAVNTSLTLKIEWDLVIIDESHSIANYNTKRAKYMLQLRDNAAKRMILTGTPIRNNPFDLYTQFEFMGKGYSGFSSFARFKEFYGVWKNIPGKGFRVLEELQNIPLLQERLAKQSFLLKLEEALPSLPESTEDLLECTLSPEQLKVYRDVATKLQAFLSDADQKINDVMVIKSHLVKLLRLAEITSGYAATDESGIYRFDPNPKLELLVTEIREFLELNPHAKVQVWCHFRENIKAITYRLNEVENIPAVKFYGSSNNTERKEAEDKFNNDPRVKVFIGSPTAGGVGLNLLGFDPYNPNKYKTNCEWAIFYSQNWSSTARLQAMARAKRKGTRIHMRYTTLVVPGSIDMMILDRVKNKIDMATTIQDIKKILAESLNPSVNGD